EPVSANTILFRLKLKPHVPESIAIQIWPLLSAHEGGQAGASRSMGKIGFEPALERLAHSYEAWHQDSTEIETNNEFFDRSLLRQSRLDIRALLEFVDSP